ncbi:hypothetical protein NLU13_5266 [Sarocladium strictum]|uniref:Uncharacterized protein n=1 Tax=Sarocladium strictum TaxID=5046 RepID=A0AA39GHU7_SARSR|nr:hypothetical protein NLU13_5266 [Sarocladium strictum]
MGTAPVEGDAASPETATLSETSNTPKAPRFQNLFSWFQLLFYASPTWIDYLLLAAGTICSAASGVPTPLMGIIFGQLVDDLNTATCAQEDASIADPDAVQRNVNKKVLILVYMGIATFCLIYLYTVSFSLFSRRLETRLRDTYLAALLRQDAEFFDSRQAGEMTTRLNADVQAVQSGTSEKVGICIACTSFFLTAYIVSFIKVWKLAAMLLSLIPAFLLSAAVCSAYTQKYAAKVSEAIEGASSIASESLSHIAVVQAFGAGPRLETKFAEKMASAERFGIKKAFAGAVQAGLLYFIAYSANGLAFWQGSRMIVESLRNDGSGTSMGEIYTVIFLLVDACVILGSIAPHLPLLQAAAGSFQKLRKDIETPAKIDSGSDQGQMLPITIEGSLSFRNISFAYISRPDQDVLKNVSFECPAGKHTALVGLSGSGKSTIAGLATRLYDPREGTVHLDGHDLRELNVKNLRSFMSLVQQEPSLLDRSILENIALGLLNSPQPNHQVYQDVILGPQLSEIASKVRDGQDLADAAASYGQVVSDLVNLVRDAASVADAASFIDRLDNGYGTLVGTSGKLVSGGQRQRIALARALIRDPKILILDEATASLDSASERRIQTAIENVAKGRTVIAIAHRLSTIKNADNIIVMNQGEIIEQGTHTELMELNGSYAGMIRLQTVEAEQQDDTHSLSSTLKDEIGIVTAEKGLAVEKTASAGGATDGKASSDSPTENESAEAEGKPALDESKSAWIVFRGLGAMVRPNLLQLIIAIIASLGVAGAFSASGLIFGNTVGKLSPCNPTSTILWAGSFFGGIYFMVGGVELFAHTLSWAGFGFVAEKLLYKVRVLSFRSLYEQGLEWHQSGGRTPTSLLSVITADAAAVGGFSGSIMGTMFSIAVNFLVAIILSHIVNWRIAIVCLVTVPLLLGSGIMQVRSLSQFERKHAGAFSDAIGITSEAVNSFKTITSLSLENEVLTSYRRALKAPRKEMTLASAYTNFWLAIANSTSGIIYAFAFWWGSTRIVKGQATQTQFFIILIAMLVSAQLWGYMFALAPELTRARAAASRILSLMDMGSSRKVEQRGTEVVTSQPKEKDVEATGEAPNKPHGGTRGSTVTFKDVSFSYPARQQRSILRGMSFTIPAGQFCGLVGPSGAGKSTIMSLVQRMYTPSGGVIEIDGQDICAREGTEFRDDIAVVPQDCALFEGTIKFNVGLGARPNEEATEADIEEACKLANIHDTIVALPDGYNTECGPNGSRLSGGQRQRLAIARALVRKPRLLLLDESTSALDAESERALQEGLMQAARGITVIAITHRLHTVRRADVIFVVEDGKIVEKGRHEELVERSETYRINALQQMLGS